MNKIKALLFFSIMLLTSCTPKIEEQVALPESYSDFFSYDTLDYLDTFNVDENGTLFLYTHTFSEDGWVDEYTLYAYDMNGTCTEICKSENSPSGFDCQNGIIYGAYPDAKAGHKLCAFDTASLEMTDICDLNGFLQINRIDVCVDTIYVQGVCSDRVGLKGEYFDEFGIYNYGGEKLISIDMSTNEISVSNVSFPIAYSLYDGNCVVYGADKDGYYFSDFNNKDKRYHEIEQLYSFDLYAPDRYIFTSGYGINSGTLCAGSTNAEDGISQVAEGYFVMESFRTIGGYTFFKAYGEESGDERLYRIKNAAYLKKNNKIRFIASEYSSDVPFGCGYTIDYNTMSVDSFALSVLSQDSNYDMCLVSSFEHFSSNIRDKGSFYPLNDIPAVTEYLDKCFPYIKKAATDKKGDIWMLPVQVDIPLIVYNEEACRELDIDFSEQLTIEDYVEVCEKAYDSEYRDGFATHTYMFTQNILIQYMVNHNVFDTGNFRTFVEFSKEKINISDYTSYPPYFPPVGDAWNCLYEDGAEKQCLFTYSRSADEALWLSEYNCFKFAEIPSIDLNDKTTATCAFITVNPSSRNLDATLDYVSSLAQYLGTQKNGFVLSGRSMYTVPDSLYNIYSDAEIGFNVSEEICYEYYVKYHRGEISLDEMISECDRVLEVYLHE